MSAKDVVAFGLTKAQKLAEEDENAARMYPLNPSDGPAPYYGAMPRRHHRGRGAGIG